MHNAEKPTILITGSGPHFGQLAQIADYASPNYLVWTGAAGTPPEWATVASSRTVSSTMVFDRDVIVVGGETGLDGNFVFPPNRGTWFIPENTSKIHHPIVLSDIANLDFSGKIISCGYPGSGNGIVQTIIEHLQPNAPCPPQSDIQIILPAYAADYLDRTKQILDKFGAALDNAQPQFATYREDYVTAQWCHGIDDDTILFGLPLRNYLYERIHKTHERCGIKIKKLIDSGAKCILAVRNPLDTIISIANKATKVTNLLETEWLLRAVARGLVAYYDSFDTVNTTVVRYEDILDDFEGEAKKLAVSMGADINDEYAARLHKDLWDRPLALAGKGHLWKPGRDKWKDYLSARHLDILYEEGVAYTMESLGYVLPERSNIKLSNMQSMAKPRYTTSRGLTFFAQSLGSIEIAVAEFQNNLGEMCCLTKSGMALVSTSAHALHAFDRFYQESDFTKLIAAAIPESSSR